jgi:hypothetical protein
MRGLRRRYELCGYGGRWQAKRDTALDVRQTSGTSDQVSSTRSVRMNLARRFNAGIRLVSSRRVATIESLWFQASLRDANTSLPLPGLERPG